MHPKTMGFIFAIYQYCYILVNEFRKFSEENLRLFIRQWSHDKIELVVCEFHNIDDTILIPVPDFLKRADHMTDCRHTLNKPHADDEEKTISSYDEEDDRLPVSPVRSVKEDDDWNNTGSPQGAAMSNNSNTKYRTTSFSEEEDAVEKVAEIKITTKSSIEVTKSLIGLMTKRLAVSKPMQFYEAINASTDLKRRLDSLQSHKRERKPVAKYVATSATEDNKVKKEPKKRRKKNQEASTKKEKSAKPIFENVPSKKKTPEKEKKGKSSKHVSRKKKMPAKEKKVKRNKVKTERSSNHDSESSSSNDLIPVRPSNKRRPLVVDNLKEDEFEWSNRMVSSEVFSHVGRVRKKPMLFQACSATKDNKRYQ